MKNDCNFKWIFVYENEILKLNMEFFGNENIEME